MSVASRFRALSRSGTKCGPSGKQERESVMRGSMKAACSGLAPQRIIPGRRFYTCPSSRPELVLPSAPSRGTILITRRTFYQFNAGTMTMRTPNVFSRPEDTLDLAPDDARRYGVQEGERVLGM